MQLTPKEIVTELDKHIVGQHEAKKAVAIAMRNRYRRQLVDEPLRHEITPKNILMIGPTGVGKTEIARRLAKLANAPFIKVEATKFTEVGYVGKDVDSIIRDLVEAAVKGEREKARISNYEKARIEAEEHVLNILLPPARMGAGNVAPPESSTRNTFREKLRNGEFDDKEIEADVLLQKPQVHMMGPAGLDELTNQMQSIIEASTEQKKQKLKMKISDALKTFTDEEANKLVNEEEVRRASLKAVEQNGIVFIDEIDKVATRSEGRSGADVSRSGVQRDLLPLVEGTAVNTKYGMIKTDHILFIASGAFHIAKPSDLLPELQGRFPIRVELNSLAVDDFEKILTSTDACLTTQYKALLATEGTSLNFTIDGVKKLAEIAFHVNEKTENIGARRLYTVMERLLEDVSFDPSKHKKLQVTADFVEERLGEIAKSEDLSRYVL